MGIGDLQLRAMDDVVRHVQDVHAALHRSAGIVDPLLFGTTRGGRSRARELASVRTQAAQAERLLAPIAATEPGLGATLDALRGVRMLQELPLADRSMVFQARSNIDRELHAVRAWRHVQPLDADARAAELLRIRTTGPVDLTREDWRTLAGILGDDVDRVLTPDVTRTLGDAHSLRDMSLLMAETDSFANRASPLHVTRQYFAAWDAAQLPRSVRLARIDELLTGDPHARTRQEWNELGALLRAGGHDLVEHAWFPEQQLERAIRTAELSGYDAARRTPIIIENASPEVRAGVRTMLLQTGELDDLATSVLRQGKLDRVGITGADAAAVRLRHLVPIEPTSAKTWMGDVRTALERLDLTGPSARLRATALELIDTNVARVDGERWWRPRDGYRNHPDYAEIGRIRSIYQLIEQAHVPASAPVPAARVATPTGDAAERLTW